MPQFPHLPDDGLGKTDLIGAGGNLHLRKTLNSKNAPPPKNKKTLLGIPVCDTNWGVSALVEVRAGGPRPYQVYRAQSGNSCTRCSWKSLPSLTSYDFMILSCTRFQGQWGIWAGDDELRIHSFNKYLSVFCILGTMSHEGVDEQHEKSMEILRSNRMNFLSHSLFLFPWHPSPSLPKNGDHI